MKYKKLCKYVILLFIAIVVIFSGTTSYATGITPETDAEEGMDEEFDDDDGVSVAPSILVMVTSFTRIIVVLHFLRTAIGTQSSPPNNVLIGLSLFLTFFIMSPVFSQVKTEAIDPLTADEISQEEAIDRCIQPVREFMLEQVRPEDLRLFMDIAEMGTVESVQDIPITVVIPAFIISELRAAFIIGFMIYIPFIVIDMVVASVLMAMGMMMLPPTTISMPFKILLFILADGWNLVIGQLVSSFY